MTLVELAERYVRLDREMLEVRSAMLKALSNGQDRSPPTPAGGRPAPYAARSAGEARAKGGSSEARCGEG
jgi:hypothetical protein